MRCKMVGNLSGNCALAVATGLVAKRWETRFHSRAKTGKVRLQLSGNQTFLKENIEQRLRGGVRWASPLMHVADRFHRAFESFECFRHGLFIASVSIMVKCANKFV